MKNYLKKDAFFAFFNIKYLVIIPFYLIFIIELG
jgi:hypothetical protein